MDINLRNTLINLGFYQNEIQAYEYIYMNGGKFTPNALTSYGYNYEQAKRLAYMNKVVQGGVQINTENDMITHYKKMTGANRQDAKVAVYSQNLQNGYAKNYSDTELVKHLKQTNGITRKITIQDLAVSNVSDVPRIAVVAGITQEPFTIWNSSNYKGMQALYRVVDVSGQKVTVETSKKPVLKYGTSKVIPGILELKGIKQNGNAVVVFDKKVCRLCNRFVVVASLKRPEFHLGCYDIICFEGTRVYVYVSNMGTRDQVRYKGGTQRVYAYGIFPGDIKGKLDEQAKKIYGNLNGVKAQYQQANQDYKVVPSEQNDSIEEEEDAVDF
jgi:hypothetical protein